MLQRSLERSLLLELVLLRYVKGTIITGTSDLPASETTTITGRGLDWTRRGYPLTQSDMNGWEWYPAKVAKWVEEENVPKPALFDSYPAALPPLPTGILPERAMAAVVARVDKNDHKLTRVVENMEGIGEVLQSLEGCTDKLADDAKEDREVHNNLVDFVIHMAERMDEMLDTLVGAQEHLIASQQRIETVEDQAENAELRIAALEQELAMHLGHLLPDNVDPEEDPDEIPNEDPDEDPEEDPQEEIEVDEEKISGNTTDDEDY